jgi:organic hydroperoxide reductase OsmC/OhrA
MTRLHDSHTYTARVTWTGAAAGPTLSYRAYSREYLAEVAGKPSLRGSADPLFRGDAGLFNPEEMLVVALSSCHMLSYLAECARAGIAVLSYEDSASGTMALRDGRLAFTEVMLRPRVTIAGDSRRDRAIALHDNAHEGCFIAASINFPVRHEPVVTQD